MNKPEGRVLIVDDSPSNLSALDSILKDEFAVSAAPGAEQALELLGSQETFDIFLLDVIMRGMDGYELCRRIKLLPAHKDVPVIFVTSMSDPENQELGFSLGAVDYILKPFNPLLVKARVRTHVSVRRHHLDLESIVASRTGELLKAKEEAEKASRAKTQFMANISHELRTPLNGITGMIQLLHETALSLEQKELVGHLNASCKRLNSLLSALMQLSKLDAGTLFKDSRPFDLRASLNLLASIYAKMADRKNLTFTMKVHEALAGRYVGDRAAMVQILVNLLDNALKYTRRGGVEVRITPMKTPPGESQDSHWISFAVRDTGVGFEEDRLPDLFRSFAISEDYLSKELDGPGLGLSLTKRLIGLLGGSLHASSKTGKGSLFRVALPFERV